MSHRHHSHASYPPEFFGKVPSQYQQGMMKAEFDEELPIAPKRLVICCDGTWQSSVSGKDKQDKIWQQVVYYDAGIASGDLGGLENLREGTMGIGFVGNAIEAYNWLVLNYNLGDEIFCFGFSRGAYTARAVAGLVTDIGIISPEDLQDFPDLFSLYKQHKDSLHFRKSKAYREWINGVLSPKAHQDLEKNNGMLVYDKAPHCDAPEETRFVKVVGVFDTVGALGIPDLALTPGSLKFLEGALGAKPGFHNVGLSPYIQHAFQALALDEHRESFTPTLWHYPVDGKQCPPASAKSLSELDREWQLLSKKDKVTEKELEAAWGAFVDAQMHEQLQDAKSELEQTWFPGVHINIGGGSKDPLGERKGDLEQIALMTFGWMIDQIKPHLQIESGGIWAFNERWQLLRPIIEDLEKGQKDYGTGYLGNTVWSALDKLGWKKADVKKLAEGVTHGWGIGPIIDSYETLMGKAGHSIYRTPGQYRTDAKKNPLGETHETVHPSVAYRMTKDPKYKPTGLSEFKRTQTKDGYIWTKGDVKIPEWIVKSEHRFTRQLASHDSRHPEGGAFLFIGEIDRLLGKDTFERTTLDIREGKIQPPPVQQQTGFNPDAWKPVS